MFPQQIIEELLSVAHVQAVVSIVSDPQVMIGKPVIATTRISVELILEKLAAGETAEQILAAHPRLTPTAISAALSFAKDNLRANYKST